MTVSSQSSSRLTPAIGGDFQTSASNLDGETGLGRMEDRRMPAPRHRDSVRWDDRQIWSIQYLRALAATAVVFYHQIVGMPIIGALGYHGVDLFFVISGFIMIVVTDRRQASAPRFVLDRLTRIVPLYWGATTLAFTLAIFGVQIYHASDDPWLLLKSLAFVPALNEAGKIQPTLFLGWTLNIEMAFYTLFALTLPFPAPYRPQILTGVIAAVVAVGTLLKPASPAWSAVTDPILMEFLIGAWLGVWFLRRRSGARVEGTSRALLPLVPFALVSLSDPRLVYGGLAYLLVLGLLKIELSGTLRRVPALKALGDASFSVYLLQEFFFKAAQALLPSVGVGAGSQLNHAVVKTGCILAAIIGGLLAHRWIEQPFTRLARSGFSKALRLPEASPFPTRPNPPPPGSDPSPTDARVEPSVWNSR